MYVPLFARSLSSSNMDSGILREMVLTDGLRFCSVIFFALPQFKNSVESLDDQNSLSLSALLNLGNFLPM